jgi:hypothetical protein
MAPQFKRLDPAAYAAGPTEGAQTKTAREQAGLKGDILSNVGKGQDIAESRETLRYKGPKAAADLTDARLKSIRDMQTNARDELKTFEGLEVVKTYEQGMRYFATALTVPKGAVGDQELVTLAAKVQDPTGAVMEGDVKRYNNVQVALDRLPQAIQNEFMRTGKFTPETRNEIIAFMRNRVDTYRAPYEETRAGFRSRIEDFNAQVAPLKIKPILPDKILPPDPLKIYAPKINAYDQRQEGQRIAAEREAGGPRVGIDERLPAGASITGEPVQGFRFNPETEAKMLAYDRSPDATPEGATKLMVEAAVKEGLIGPEQQQSYAAATLANMREFFKQPPEVRAQVGSINYSDIDRAATENAGLFASVAQAASNIPESSAALLQGFVNLPASVKTLGEAAAAVIGGDQNDPTVKAITAMLEDRYGSLDALKRTAITDPVGIAGDLSMVLTAGGSTAARLPGMAGRIGEGVATAGRALDPVSAAVGLVTEGAPAAFRAAQQRAPGAVQGLGNLPSEIAGFPSGAGGVALREATGAGFERGVTGAPTPRTEALTGEMRSPGEGGETLLNAARSAVQNLRDQGAADYNRLMQQFGQSPKPLDITTVQARLQQLKPRSYDTWSQRRGERPPVHRAWEQMNDFVNEYAGMAQKNPNLLLPLEMDQFKQDLFDVGSRLGGNYDRDAARIASGAYNAVRQELVRHDNIYADAMRAYEGPALEAKQLEATFGLAAGRGKQPNIESVSRRLQAAMRNNANVGYGTREQQARRLNELDPDRTIIPTLAGSQLSSIKPRGLQSAVSAGLGGVGALLNPAALLFAPAFSPRVMGEAAYGLGRLAGTATRAGQEVAGSDIGRGIATAGRGLADLYQKYPTVALAGAELGARGEDVEQQALMERYGEPGVPLLPRDKFDEELEKLRLLREYGLLD